MKKKFLNFIVFTIFLFIICIANVKAEGQCYDCGINDKKGWYSWSDESSNPNPQVCKKSNLTHEECKGSYDHTPTCFYCLEGNDEYYKWSDNGINPNSAICGVIGLSKNDCHLPEEVPTGDGADTSGNDQKDFFTGGGGGFCTKTSKILKFIGKIFRVFRILVPVLIIIFASIDMFKAVTAQKDDEIKKATDSLVKRLILAVLIFFVPTFVSMIFNLMGSFMEGDMESEYKLCASCILAEDDC